LTLPALSIRRRRDSTAGGSEDHSGDGDGNGDGHGNGDDNPARTPITPFRRGSRYCARAQAAAGVRAAAHRATEPDRMADERDVPTGRFGRLARLAAAGARGVAAHAVGRRKSGAEQAAQALGNLRGLAAKAGQMVSYVDGVFSEQDRAVYADAFAMLRARAPHSSAAEVRRIVEEELDAPVDELFAEWESEPFASASIGQVHRARLKDGSPVAVKVQHPGIVAALESDLANAGMLERMFSPLGLSRFNAREILATVRQRFLEEVDYGSEADRTDQFARLFKGDPELHVPRVYRQRSGRRVLTTEFVEGLPFESLAQAPEEERRRVAAVLWRFVFRSILVGGVFNADPHPGNYILMPEGRVCVLDHGCVQDIVPHRLDASRRLHEAAIAGDMETFDRWSGGMVSAKPGALGDRARAYMRTCFEPILTSPYRITRAWTADLLHEMKAMGVKAAMSPDEEFFSMPPEVVFMNRLQFGFYSILASLDVAVDYRAVEASFAHEITRAA